MRRFIRGVSLGFGVFIFILSTLFLAGAFFSCQPSLGMASEGDDDSDFLVLQKAPAVYKKPAAAIGTFRLYRDHIVIPREEIVEDYLRDKQAIPLKPTGAQVKSAVKGYYKNFFNTHDTWISPQVKENALKRETELRSMDAPRAVQPVEATVFALAVEFGGTDTYEIMTGMDYTEPETVTTSGPLKGRISEPGPLDNNTVWYDPAWTADAKFYEKLIFGYDGAGRIRMDLFDPYDGQPGINLAGYTVQDYYDHVAGEGNVAISGTVEGWVTVDHSEGYYGADVDDSTPFGGAIVEGKYIPVAQLVIDAVDKFNEAHPEYYNETGPNAFWKKYDGNQDGIIDTFWLIHAGCGQEAGGGAEEEFAIWSHSSDLRNYSYWPEGYKVYEGDPGTATDDICIGPYTMQPENAELGVLSEEFGHNFFGLPDLYTNDIDNSVGFWSHMSGGSWGGWLGGTVPVGMPLWFREIAQCEGLGFLNWQEPLAVLDYEQPAVVTIGQLEETPVNTYKGLRLNLPDITESTENKAGSGKCAYTYRDRNETELTLDREITVSDAVYLNFDSYWDIEEDWDYGYVLIKDGDTWDILEESCGKFTTTNPHGNNLGCGLTGSGRDKLYFDLSPYLGKTVTLRLLYKTDPAVTGEGWWVDNIMLNNQLVDNFETSTESSISGWINSDPGWFVAPYTASYANYYLVEWRAPTKYDQSVQTAYVTTISNENEWRVERVPYNIPGALLYYRNARYSNTYYLSGQEYEPPSIGPKYQLLVVDMNYNPLLLGDSGFKLGCRTSSYDAALTLQPSHEINLSGVSGVPGGPWTFEPKAPITNFDDYNGYYAGFYTDGIYAYYHNRAGSCVIPARGVYSTRITWPDGTPCNEFYGYTLNGLPLGSGNPGDDDVEYGVKIELIAKSENDDLATLCVNMAQAGTRAGLSSLNLEGIELKPQFAGGREEYTAGVAAGVNETVLTAAVSEEGSIIRTVTVNGVETFINKAEISLPVALDSDTNVIEIAVFAEDGQNSKTYKVSVYKGNFVHFFRDYQNKDLKLLINTFNNSFQLELPGKVFSSRKANYMKVVDFGAKKQPTGYNTRTGGSGSYQDGFETGSLLGEKTSLYKGKEKEEPPVWIYLSHQDAEIKLEALSIGGSTDTCLAIVYDLKAREAYILYDRLGVEKNKYS